MWRNPHELTWVHHNLTIVEAPEPALLEDKMKDVPGPTTVCLSPGHAISTIAACRFIKFKPKTGIAQGFHESISSDNSCMGHATQWEGSSANARTPPFLYRRNLIADGSEAALRTVDVSGHSELAHVTDSFEFRIHFYGDAGNCGVTDTEGSDLAIFGNRRPLEPLPAAPTALTGSWNGTTAIDLSWTDSDSGCAGGFGGGMLPVLLLLATMFAGRTRHA